MTDPGFENRLRRDLEDRIRVIAFDVDGTLTDSIEQIITCFQRTFERASLPVPSREAVKGTIGMSLHLGVQSLLPDPEDDALGARITQLYRDTFTVSRDIHETRLFDGVLDLLFDLKSRGYTLAVASGKSKVGVMRMFSDIPELAECLTVICTGDMTESKPHPAMLHRIARDCDESVSAILMAGDAGFDVIMGQRAGALTLGVLTGVCDDKEMRELGPDYVLERVTDLRRFI